MDIYTVTSAPDRQGRIAGQIGPFKFAVTLDGGKLEQLALYDGGRLVAHLGGQGDVCPKTPLQGKALEELLEFLETFPQCED